MTDSMATKHERTRKKYNFYMDIRKKIITIMVICVIGSVLAGIIAGVKFSLAMGIFLFFTCAFSFIVPLYIIERIWTLVNVKVRNDFVDGI